MKLWIRSQDREILIEAQLLDIYNASVEEECYVIEESGTDLGSYKTKARALEVLDDIQNFIENRNKIKITQDINGIISETEEPKKVYEMPKE